MSAPARVAIVGSGPSGFYAAEALLRSGVTLLVDMFERLPVPHGLVRFGVAPDHPKLKQVSTVFDRIADMAGFRFIGGVEVGSDITVSELSACYHAVILATGASVDRRMGIVGEDLAGCHTAGDFIGWYNGHPDFSARRYDFSCERAVVIGHGNVALDVARILVKTADELRHTDIARHALDALAESRIREVHIVGRGGIERAKFSTKELREFGELADCDAALEPTDMSSGIPDLAEDATAEIRANLEILAGFAARRPTKRRRCVFRFNCEPAVIGGKARVEHILLRRKESRSTVALDCGFVISSIGRHSAPLGGVPYDEVAGVHANVGGRAMTGGTAVPGLYVCGWSKRGPRGTIGTNRACSMETVEAVLADLAVNGRTPHHDADELVAQLAQRKGFSLDYSVWRRINAAEQVRGVAVGKPREKFVSRDDMNAFARQELVSC
jgi:ferredoxin--NADP+ reductase